MSIDDLITLLLVILFVGAPLARRILGRRGSQPSGGAGEEQGDPRGDVKGERPEARAERRPQEQRRPQEPGTARADRTETPARGDRADPSSDFERRIAEARRRVQQAMGDQGANATDRDRALDEPKPLFAPREAIPQALLGREGVREPRKKTPPLQVVKRRRGRAATRLTGGRGVVSMHPHDILQGIVWHQILSEPVSKRTSRRKPSRVR